MATGVDLGQISKLFNPKVIAQELEQSEPVESFFKDHFFTDRKNHPFSYVGTNIVTKILQSMSMILPGGMPEGMRKKAMKNIRISPDPVGGKLEFNAEEVLQIIEAGGQTLQQWRSEVIEDAKKNVAFTVENMSRKSISGKLEWNARGASGITEKEELYDFSSFIDLKASLGWKAATKLSTVVKTLDEMWKVLELRGVIANTVDVLASSTMFYTVLDLINTKNKNDVLGAVYNGAKGAIVIGKYTIWNEDGAYNDAGTAQTAGVAVATDQVQMIANTNSKLRYLKQGNFTVGFNSAPFILIPEITQGGNMLTLWIYSKPVPIFDPISTIKGKDGA
jgi:hypothetical protein